MREYAGRIGEGGLYPGGPRGAGYRADVHIVGTVNDAHDQAGFRSGTDTIVKIDMNAYHDLQGRLYFSSQHVFLTPGIDDGRNRNMIHVPPSCIIDIIDKVTGLSVMPPRPPGTDENGEPDDGEYV